MHMIAKDLTFCLCARVGGAQRQTLMTRPKKKKTPGNSPNSSNFALIAPGFDYLTSQPSVSWKDSRNPSSPSNVLISAASSFWQSGERDTRRRCPPRFLFPLASPSSPRQSFSSSSICDDEATSLSAARSRLLLSDLSKSCSIDYVGSTSLPSDRNLPWGDLVNFVLKKKKKLIQIVDIID